MSDSWDPMDCRPPGSSVHGILQAKTLERVTIPFSRGSSRPRDRSEVCTAGRFFTVWATREAQRNTGKNFQKAYQESKKGNMIKETDVRIRLLRV